MGRSLLGSHHQFNRPTANSIAEQYVGVAVAGPAWDGVAGFGECHECIMRCPNAWLFFCGQFGPELSQLRRRHVNVSIRVATHRKREMRKIDNAVQKEVQTMGELDTRAIGR
jgi:hypothetical protein